MPLRQQIKPSVRRGQRQFDTFYRRYLFWTINGKVTRRIVYDRYDDGTRRLLLAGRTRFEVIR